MAIRRSIWGVAAMGAWFLLLRPEIAALDNLPLFVRLMTDVTLGGVIYTATLVLAWIVEGKPDGVERTVWGAAKSLRQRLATN